MILSVTVLLTLSMRLVSTVNIEGLHTASGGGLTWNNENNTPEREHRIASINLTRDISFGSSTHVHNPTITAHTLGPDRKARQPSIVPPWDYAKHGADWTSGMCKIGKLQSPVDLHVDGLGTQRPENIKDALQSVLKGVNVSQHINNEWRRGDMVYTYRHLISTVQVLRTDKIFRLSVPPNEGSTFGALFTTDRPNLYAATHIEFHSPSEHTFDGSANRRQVEVQIWHYYGDEADAGIGALEKNETTDMNVMVSSSDNGPDDIRSNQKKGETNKLNDDHPNKSQNMQRESKVSDLPVGKQYAHSKIDEKEMNRGEASTYSHIEHPHIYANGNIKTPENRDGNDHRPPTGRGHDVVTNNKGIASSEENIEERKQDGQKIHEHSQNRVTKVSKQEATNKTKTKETTTGNLINMGGEKITAETLLQDDMDEPQKTPSAKYIPDNTGTKKEYTDKRGEALSLGKDASKKQNSHDMPYSEDKNTANNSSKNTNSKWGKPTTRKAEMEKPASKSSDRQQTHGKNAVEDEDGKKVLNSIDDGEEHVSDEEDFKEPDEEKEDDLSFIEIYSDVKMKDGTHIINPKSASPLAFKHEVSHVPGRIKRKNGEKEGCEKQIDLEEPPHHPLKTEKSAMYKELVENEQFELLNKYLLDHLHNAAYDKIRDRNHVFEKMKARQNNTHWGRWAVLSMTFMSEEMEKTKIEVLKSFPSERFMEQVLKVGSKAEITDSNLYSSAGELNSGTYSNLPVVELDTPINLSSLLMMIETKDLNYFAYDGSFTRPGCEETVRWYVAKEPLPVSTELMLKIHRMLNQTRHPTSTSEPISKYRELQNVNENLHNSGKVHLVHGYPMEYFIATSFNHPKSQTREPSSMMATSLASLFVAMTIFVII